MITVIVEYTEDDYVRASKVVYRKTMKWFYLVIVVALLFMFVSYFRQPQDWNWVSFAPPVAVWLVLLLGLPMLQSWQIKRAIKNMPAAQGVFTYNYTDEGFEATGSSQKLALGWDLLVKVTETEDDFYFYLSKQQAKFLPKKAFTSDLQQSQLRLLLKNKMGDKAQLNS
jgi:hypothetical protein